MERFCKGLCDDLAPHAPIAECYDNMGKKLPTIANGISKISRLIVKQNVQGTTRLVGLKRIQVVITVCSVFSNAWVENFSQYSTADWLSMSS